ncbi:MAG: ABC transporter substrate-binding protein [Oscillospiraceae bacterium]|jgi:NitT/TauT family transport system substrate-binding protein|nr:ABC transporter substrate-binding protein [Oscillospiraceae bacterium]
MKVSRKAFLPASIFLAAAMVLALFSGCSGDTDSLTVVRVSEVTHSVFYAPNYLAMELGYFEEEGIAIEMISGEGADKVMTGVVSGAVDVGFSGPEAAIYIYNEGKEDFARVFAQITKRDGSFLMAREPDPDFTWQKIAGTHVLPGRKGGVPYMTFEYVVKQAGLVPGVDVNFDNSIQYAAMTGAFLGGTGDYVTVFEPTASSIEAEGKGYIVASVGEASGEIPYTCWYALGSYIDENPGIIQGMTNAIAKGQKYLMEHSAEEVAAIIAPSFPDADVAIMASAIARYKEIDAYNSVPMMTEDAFNRLQTVMDEAGELNAKVPYADMIDNSFGEKAMENL